MSTFTIIVECASNPYPHSFCLIFGEPACETLCNAFDSNGCV